MWAAMPLPGNRLALDRLAGEILQTVDFVRGADAAALGNLLNFRHHGCQERLDILGMVHALFERDRQALEHDARRGCASWIELLTTGCSGTAWRASS